MIALLARPSLRARVRASLGEQRCIVAHGHADLRQLAPKADALVVEAREASRAIDVVRRIRHEHPLLPIIVIGGRETPNLRVPPTVSDEAVLAELEVHLRRPNTLSHLAGAPSALRALSKDYLENEAIRPALRRLLALALTTSPPPRTVNRLAQLLGCAPSTIRRQWRQSVNPSGLQRPKDLLDWLVLLNAVSTKRPGLNWRVVAASIGTHERTLSRLAVRLTGDTLASLYSRGGPQLFDRFAQSLDDSFCAILS